MSVITIDVDGLGVEVDEAEYAADPDLVVGNVRTMRVEAVGNAGGHDIAPDYDELVAIFGEKF